jgi:CRP-like cAMP-binding protein
MNMRDQMTNNTNIFEILRELEFLRGVSDESIRELAKLGTVVEFPANVVIFHNGEPAVCAYLMLEGCVSLEICGSGVGCTQLMTIGNGQLLGASPVLGQTTFSATARTMAPTRAFALQGSDVVKRCEQNREFGYEFMRCTALAMAKRLTATRLQALDMYRAETPTQPPD